MCVGGGGSRPPPPPSPPAPIATVAAKTAEEKRATKQKTGTTRKAKGLRRFRIPLTGGPTGLNIG